MMCVYTCHPQAWVRPSTFYPCNISYFVPFNAVCFAFHSSAVVMVTLAQCDLSLFLHFPPAPVPGFGPVVGVSLRKRRATPASAPLCPLGHSSHRPPCPLPQRPLLGTGSVAGMKLELSGCTSVSGPGGWTLGAWTTASPPAGGVTLIRQLGALSRVVWLSRPLSSGRKVTRLLEAAERSRPPLQGRAVELTTRLSSALCGGARKWRHHWGG